MSKTHKIILAGIITVLLIAGVAWKAAAPRVLAGVEGLLLSQVNSSINGRIEIGAIDFSVLGSAVLKNVKLFDKTDSKVAESAAISVSYKFSDLIGGRFGVDSVKSIDIDNVDLKLSIDKAGKWSLQDLVKPREERPSVFHGSITLKNAAVSVTTPNWTRNFTEISGELDYSVTPDVAVDLKGKLGKSSISAKGVWTPDDKAQLALKIDSFELVEAQALLPAAAGTPKLTGGTLKDVQGTVIQDKSGVQMSGEASLTGLSVELQGTPLQEGSAKLKLAGKKVAFQEGSVVIDGNRVTVAGAIDFSPASPALALQVASAGLNVASLSKQQASLTGSAAFQAEVGGTIDNPTSKGSFKLNGGQFDGNPVTDAEGTFTYSGGALTLDNVNAKAMGGALGISGTLRPQTSAYNLKVSGQNIDGAILTNKGLMGHMDFSATVSGQGGPDSMVANGTFAVQSGAISDYVISNANGNFHKQGNRVDLSNVGFTLSGQRLAVSGTITLAAAGASPQINLNISSAGLSAAVFNPNSALKGQIAFQATVTGTPEKNQSRGNFQIASGSLGQLAFTAASGGFSYGDGLLTLQNARAQSLGGSIAMNGTVVPKTMEYHQQVTGQNIDAAQLTDHDVQGRADFTASINGVGDWDKANGDGNFKMNSGSVKGISFSSLTGNFTKRGRQTEFTNLKFNMLGGLASGTGETEGENIHLIITPNPTANAALTILTGKSLQPQDLRVRFRGPNG